MSSLPSVPEGSVEERLSPIARATLYLLYHELSADPGDYRYALGTTVFREHLRLCQRLRQAGHHGLYPEITFDDGHLSNFEHALPALAEAGLKAHFFITAGWTAQRQGYMSWEQVRAIAEAGHPIGAHGWSHKLLTHCSDAELEIELDRARALLQDKLGLAVTGLSLPGGRFNERVLAACRQHGYSKIFTSIPRVEGPMSGRSGEMIGRLNLRSNASREWLEAVLASPTGPIRRIARQHRLKTAVQQMLGDGLYAKLWAVLNKAQTSAELS